MNFNNIIYKLAGVGINDSIPFLLLGTLAIVVIIVLIILNRKDKK